MSRFPAMVYAPRAEEPEEIVVGADATPLDFLQAVYRNSRQPMPRRMKAAEAALQFVHPKLAAIANSYSFADQMNVAARLAGKSNVIDAKPRQEIGTAPWRAIPEALQTDPSRRN